jgi:hypothetical protein
MNGASSPERRKEKMNNETYNGWTNYETWKVNLEIFDGVTAKDLWGMECKPEWLEDYVREIINEEAEGFALSCANSSLSAVNWHEIAEHLNED